MARLPERPKWVTLRDALTAFANAADQTQGQRHIRPLHWYVACRLVVEGGFHPDHIVPRPPFTVRTQGSTWILVRDDSAAVAGERTVYGGLRTKGIDVVVSVGDIGPCVAVSMKGTLKAFRNLTNRMEEAAGDCTNLHIAYPALVYAFWNVLRGNRGGPLPPGAPSFLEPDAEGNCRPADVAIRLDGTPTSTIARYHFALEGLNGRSSIRQEPSLYEAVGMTLVSPDPQNYGRVMDEFPRNDSPLALDKMFRSIYQQYDLRFVYQAPALAQQTRRRIWAEESPALQEPIELEYEPRVRSDQKQDDEGEPADD